VQACSSHLKRVGVPYPIESKNVMDPLIATLGETFFKLFLGGVATFLILLVLVQRGRGGGLAGALGGMGGSSAFGAKSGDVFTKITVVSAAFWILLCIAAAKYAAPTGGSRVDVSSPSGSSITSSAPAEDKQEDSASSENTSVEETSTEAPASDETSTDETSAPPEEES